jgi:triosephosphate isomerase
MPRTPIVAGNWKMNTLRSDAIALAKAIRDQADAIPGVEKILCPPFVFLHDVAAAVAGSTVRVGSQNVYWEEKGAFTGEISVTQVAEVAQFAIIGHSERRQFFGETDETVNRRVKSALAHGLKPIMCVGELLEQRNAGETESVLLRQTRGGLDGVELTPDFIIAYEPVWAIGTGRTPSEADIAAVHADIRARLVARFDAAGEAVRILYGGSMKPANAAAILALPHVNGGLVGGASLRAADFLAIARTAAR